MRTLAIVGACGLVVFTAYRIHSKITQIVEPILKKIGIENVAIFYSFFDLRMVVLTTIDIVVAFLPKNIRHGCTHAFNIVKNFWISYQAHCYAVSGAKLSYENQELKGLITSLETQLQEVSAQNHSAQFDMAEAMGKKIESKQELAQTHQKLAEITLSASSLTQENRDLKNKLSSFTALTEVLTLSQSFNQECHLLKKAFREGSLSSMVLKSMVDVQIPKSQNIMRIHAQTLKDLIETIPVDAVGHESLMQAHLAIQTQIAHIDKVVSLLAMPWARVQVSPLRSSAIEAEDELQKLEDLMTLNQPLLVG